MCEVTGGRSYCITSHRMLNQCIDSLVQKVQNGVVINFEKIGPDPQPTIEKQEDSNLIKDENGSNSKESECDSINGNERGNIALVNTPQNTSWYNCRKMIYVPRQQKGYPCGNFLFYD